MNVFDQGSRFATFTEPMFVLARVAILAELDVRFRTWFETQTIPLPRGTNRIADLVAVMDDLVVPEKPWLFLHEFQSAHDPAKLPRMFTEAAVFQETARDLGRDDRRFQILPVLVYLKGKCPERRIDMLTPNGLGMGFFPIVWEVETDDALEQLQGVAAGRVSWGALFWTSLMKGGDTAEVLSLWLRLLDEVVPEGRRSDVAYVVLAFSELSGCRIEWISLLEGRKLVESILGREMMELGAAKARLGTKREDLLRVVKTLYRGEVPEEYLELIRTQESVPVLDMWFQSALEAENVDAFLAAMRQ